MVQEIYDKYIFIYAMAGLCLLGTLLKIMVSRTYKRLIKASDNMGSTEHKLIKLMKMKFEACYKLKIGVNNVDSFVDKYVYKHKICGIHLYTWENISGQLLILCLLTGTVGSVLGLVYKCGKTDILITFFAGIFTSSMLIVVESFINLGAKKSIVKANITDYLENFLKVRLEQENFKPEVLDEYRKEYFKNDFGEKNKWSKKVDETSSVSVSNIEKSKKKDNKLQEDYVESKGSQKPQVNEEGILTTGKAIKKSKVEKYLETASALETEQPKSKKDREKEMLLREQQYSNRTYQNRSNPKNRDSNDSKEQVLKTCEQDNLQPNYPINSDEEEDMRFLIKSLMDTVTTDEESESIQEFKKQDLVDDRNLEKQTIEQQGYNKKASSTVDIEEIDQVKTENENKIIEDILREFLA